MKQSCPKCKTLIEINEKEYAAGSTVVKVCPLCDGEVTFKIPEKKTEDSEAYAKLYAKMEAMEREMREMKSGQEKDTSAKKAEEARAQRSEEENKMLTAAYGKQYEEMKALEQRMEEMRGKYEKEIAKLSASLKVAEERATRAENRSKTETAALEKQQEALQEIQSMAEKMRNDYERQRTSMAVALAAAEDRAKKAENESKRIAADYGKQQDGTKELMQELEKLRSDYEQQRTSMAVALEAAEERAKKAKNESKRMAADYGKQQDGTKELMLKLEKLSGDYEREREMRNQATALLKDAEKRVEKAEKKAEEAIKRAEKAEKRATKAEDDSNITRSFDNKIKFENQTHRNNNTILDTPETTNVMSNRKKNRDAKWKWGVFIVLLLTVCGVLLLCVSKCQHSEDDIPEITTGGSDYPQENIEEKYFKITGVTLELIKVNAGTFTMGCTEEQGSDCWADEKPAHEVTITEDYWIAKYEVTEKLWEAVMGNTKRLSKSSDVPMTNVTVDEARAFCEKLSELTGETFTLPTEAEWEYAARGGHKATATKYSGSQEVGDVAWYGVNSRGVIHPVGKLKANELGLFDMSGNAQEWCSDKYSDYKKEFQTDPKGPESGERYVIRGGDCTKGARDCRVNARSHAVHVYRDATISFRVVMRNSEWKDAKTEMGKKEIEKPDKIKPSEPAIDSTTKDKQTTTDKPIMRDKPVGNSGRNNGDGAYITTESKQGFDIIAGYHAYRSTAIDLCKKLKSKGSDAYIIEKNGMYYVSLGSAATRTEAEKKYWHIKEWYTGDISIKQW